MQTLQNLLKNCAVSPTDSLQSGHDAIEEGGIRLALVLGPQLEFLGVLSVSDVLAALMSGASLNSPIEQHYNRNVVSVGPEAGRVEVLELMESRNLRRIPIVDERGRLAGVHLRHEMVARDLRPNATLILAGGRGTRLLPLTESIPKPMLKVAGRPILERLLLHLIGFGLRRFYFSVNYLAHQIEEYFGDGSQFGCRIHYLNEDEPLGTAGPLSLIEDRIEAPMLILNGDLLTEANVGEFLDHHERRAHDFTVGVRSYYHQIPFGCLYLEGGRVLKLEEKPTINRTISAGMYVVSPKVLQLVPAHEEFPMPDLIQRSIDKGLVVGTYEIHEDWIDVGQRDQLLRARGIV